MYVYVCVCVCVCVIHCYQYSLVLQKLQDLLRRCQEGLGVDDADPYDWEKSSSSAPLSLTSFCSPVVQDQ